MFFPRILFDSGRAIITLIASLSIRLKSGKISVFYSITCKRKKDEIMTVKGTPSDSKSYLGILAIVMPGWVYGFSAISLPFLLLGIPTQYMDHNLSTANKIWTLFTPIVLIGILFIQSFLISGVLWLGLWIERKWFSKRIKGAEKA
jgi:hypothetical protein